MRLYLKDKVFKEDIKAKYKKKKKKGKIQSYRWTLTQYDWYPYKRLGHRHTQTKGQSYEKSAICKPRRQASEETKPANTLILDFRLPEL